MSWGWELVEPWKWKREGRTAASDYHGREVPCTCPDQLVGVESCGQEEEDYEEACGRGGGGVAVEFESGGGHGGGIVR